MGVRGLTNAEAVREMRGMGAGSGFRLGRALVLGNGAPGAEHQSLGLVQCLGMTSDYTLQVSSGQLIRIVTALPYNI